MVRYAAESGYCFNVNSFQLLYAIVTTWILSRLAETHDINIYKWKFTVGPSPAGWHMSR